MNHAIAQDAVVTPAVQSPADAQALSVRGLLRHFSTHSLRDVGEQSLMNRYDTKYLLPLKHLDEFLQRICHDYSVLEIDGRLVHGYQTEYFDTPDFSHYLAHHNNRSPRSKVRRRTYVDSGRRYLELKLKNNKGKTEKQRVPLVVGASEQDVGILLHAAPFISLHSGESLQPRLTIDYSRIALWSRQHGERVSIDIGLHATRADDAANGFNLDELVIVEVKQGAINRASPARAALRHFMVRPLSFSKYCIACALLYTQQLKINRFRKLLLKLRPYLAPTTKKVSHARF